MALDGDTHDDAVEENAALAQAAGLVYVHDDDPGITRTGTPNAFDYLRPNGQPVKDPATLERIRKLAIPPAYREVWICPRADGHLQATGRDDRGRKQYRYHDEWSAMRGETKFARMAAFGRMLPRIRKRVEADLGKRGAPLDKAVALVVRLLELTLIRVGNDAYARENRSFGLTTLRNRHVDLHGATLELEFKGKSGIVHKVALHDRRLVRIVRSIQELPGQRLFQYLDADGTRHAVESRHVNAYLQEITGEAFTAKDFRTWAGTIAAAKALAMQPYPESAAAAKRTVALCVKATAGLLGNTPAVCRAAYIHPGVLKAFADKALPKRFATAEGPSYERAMLRFLDALSEDVEKTTGLSKRAQVGVSGG
ncbi:DNA topoisomerase IB [Caulobacter sp. S45]|uniref:DNA topoisomerase IB n=1 Tax=Caulobacter sp. S45 TaxID=1641861 RepID=UPI00131CD438|nr:DNA topoisomerase IB [Caulobacter sp. S45]